MCKEMFCVCGSLSDCQVENQNVLCSSIVTVIHVYITQAQSPDGLQKEEVKRSDIFGTTAGEKDKQRSMRTWKVFPSSPTADIINHNST